MQVRGLLVAALALVLAGGLAYWSNRTKKDDATSESDKNPKLVEVKEADVQKIQITRKGDETTVLSRTGESSWKVTSPAEYPTDKDAVSTLLSSVTTVASDRVVEEKPESLDAFGLQAPAIEVLITKKDGKSVKLLLGDEAPTGSGVFAKTEGDPKVYTIASYTKTSIDKKAADLRDKRLLTFDSDKLARVELTAEKTTTEFSRNAANEWQIVKPKPYRADNFQVEELVRRLREAKLEPTMSEEDQKKAAAAFGSASPVAVAVVTDNAGTQRLEVRKTKDNKYYAKSSVVDGVWTVPADIGDGLGKSTDDFRAKKLFDFGFSDPTRIEYKDDKRTLTLSKSGEKWSSGGKEMDSVSVQSLVDKLRDLAAEKFVETGFTTPVIEIAVTSNDGKRTERVAFAKAGDKWLGRRENEPSLYQVETRLVEELQRSAGDVKEPAPPAKKDEKKK